MKTSGFTMGRTFTYVVLVYGLCSGCMLMGDEHGARTRGLADEALCDGEMDYVVRQGDFTTTIQAIEGSKSARDFYAYDRVFNASAATGLERAEESTIFIYRDTATNRFSLFLIHDKPGNRDGGSSQLLIRGLDNASTVAANDDPHEGIRDVPTSETVASWNWNSCCTDGTAVTFTGGEICVTIEPEVMTGIETWSVVSGMLAQPTRTRLPSLMEPFSPCRRRSRTPASYGETCLHCGRSRRSSTGSPSTRRTWGWRSSFSTTRITGKTHVTSIAQHPELLDALRGYAAWCRGAPPKSLSLIDFQRNIDIRLSKMNYVQ